jgi:hypothetical protein
MEKDSEYLKSLHRCPICGGLIGCKENDCDMDEFRAHVGQCRETNRVKPLKERRRE